MNDKPEYFSVRQTAMKFGVCQQTVRRCIERGQIRAIRLPGGRFRISAVEIEALAAQGGQGEPR